MSSTGRMKIEDGDNRQHEDLRITECNRQHEDLRITECISSISDKYRETIEMKFVYTIPQNEVCMYNPQYKNPSFAIEMKFMFLKY